MIYREIGKLVDSMQDIMYKVIEELDTYKIGYFINETYRSQEVQNAYYAQGRESLIIVNTLRKKAGLYLLDEPENKNKVTNAKVSVHSSGRAIDIVPVDSKNRPTWNADMKYWKAIADVCKKYGLEWGGDWKDFPDLPHYQAK